MDLFRVAVVQADSVPLDRKHSTMRAPANSVGDRLSEAAGVKPIF